MKRFSLLQTDLYQLTMAYGYWKSKRSDWEAVFHLFFRSNPFGGQYSIACGLADAIEYLNGFQFEENELSYLSTLTGNDGEVLFEEAFIDYLRNLKFECDVDAIEEGTVVFPHEPLMRIKGPILQCQILETALLNIINFQTLIATKASRVVQATQGEPVLEFGLRRAQAMDGALSASRAAYIGGCSATSNVYAGMKYGIPVKGTHAHSWIMSFDDEEEAFQAYADAMPNNCVFLVDTYNTVEGVKKAISVGCKLGEQGKQMVGIRLDSGDLAELSIQARKLLDDAGFSDAVIVASNDLEEEAIAALKAKGAKIGVWGVGTKLVTAYDQPALGGVYKLGAIRGTDGAWQYRIKLSEQVIKVSNPGIQQVRRFKQGEHLVGDMIYNVEHSIDESLEIRPLDGNSGSMQISPDWDSQDLLKPIFEKGKQVYKIPAIGVVRERTFAELRQLDVDCQKLKSATPYFVGLDVKLNELKSKLMSEKR